MRNGPRTLGTISGRRETDEMDPIQTAVREAKEEYFGESLTEDAFRKNVITSKKVNSTHVYILAFKESLCWKGHPDCEWELDRTVFPNGHVWVSYEELRDLVFNDGTVFSIPLWPYRKYMFRCMWQDIHALITSSGRKKRLSNDS